MRFLDKFKEFITKVGQYFADILNTSRRNASDITSASTDYSGNAPSSPKSNFSKDDSEVELAKRVQALPQAPTKKIKLKSDDELRDEALAERLQKLTDGKAWNPNASIQDKVNKIHQHHQQELPSQTKSPNASPLLNLALRKEALLQTKVANLKGPHMQSVKIKLQQQLNNLHNNFQSLHKYSDAKKLHTVIKPLLGSLKMVDKTIKALEKFPQSRADVMQNFRDRQQASPSRPFKK